MDIHIQVTVVMPNEYAPQFPFKLETYAWNLHPVNSLATKAYSCIYPKPSIEVVCMIKENYYCCHFVPVFVEAN